MSKLRLLKSRQPSPPIESRGQPWPPGLYPSRHPSAVRTGRTWSGYRPMPIHAGTPIVPARLVAHQIIAATRAPYGDLMHRGSLPTWVKPSRRPTNLPRPSSRPSTRSSSTRTHRIYHSVSSWEETSGQPYDPAPTPSTWPQRSPWPLSSTPPHWRPSGAAKEIKIMHKQRTVKTRHPVRPPT